MLRPLRVRIPAALIAALYLAIPGGAAGVRPCLHHDGLVPESAIADHAGAEVSHAGDENLRADAHDHAEPINDDGASRAHGNSDTHEGCSCLEACAAGAAIALDAVAPVVPMADESVARALLPKGDAPNGDRPSHFLPFATAPPSVPV